MTITNRPTPMRSHGTVYDTAEEALVRWGQFNGHRENLHFALDLIRTAAANRRTVVDHAFTPASDQYVAVVLADDPRRVAMTIHFGFTFHDDPALPFAALDPASTQGAYCSPHPTNRLRPTGADRARQAMDALPHKHCVCAPGIHQAPHAAECSECGTPFPS